MVPFSRTASPPGQRLSLLADGRVSLELKRPHHDGTTHLVFEPLVFIERLAALVPKPNKTLVIYSGVLAPNAELRSAVVAYGRPVPVAASILEAVDAEAPPTDTATAPIDTTPPREPSKPKSGRPNYRWPEPMRRSFGIDALQCKVCGGVLKLVDIVTHPRAIRGILKRLGLPTGRRRCVHPAPRPMTTLTSPVELPRRSRPRGALRRHRRGCSMRASFMQTP